MTPEILRDKLKASAAELGWPVSDEPNFASKRFRGREDDSPAELPAAAIGIRLGHYPVIVAAVSLDDVPSMQESLRVLHSQMVIARSYMRPTEVINAHLVLCAIITSPGSDWRRVVDLAERDEAVCRKLIWMPGKDNIDDSYADFISHSFLAQPWRSAEKVMDAPLDHNQGLVQRILIGHGLTLKEAEQWVRLAERNKDDPDGLVEQLVAAMGMPA